ncbi:MAG: hypothetical protein P4L10_16300 [Acidobacteriaceae bacterium]|nr:hypothetical protein [Acidobacteriaceae bacterium]
MAELNAYLKKRAAETGTTGLELHPGSEKDASKVNRSQYHR